MENQGKLMPESVIGWSEGEEGVSTDLLAVRSLLRSLPTSKCAPGFEYRLQRKLEGPEAGVRSAGSARNWTLGWVGAGLGLATAVAIGFFVFDLNVKSPSDAGFSSLPVAGVSSGGPAVPNGPAPQTVSAQRLVSQDKQLAAADKDTTKPAASKPDLDPQLFHVTGSNAGK